MKKFLSAVLALIFFCAPFTVSAADSANEKLIQIENDTYGTEQTGAILDRISRIEQDYSGQNMRGNLNVRIDSVYEILYGNIGTPSILAKINAIEWNTYHEVSGKSVNERLIRLEREIFGNTSTDDTFIKRIDTIANACFGTEQIPLVEMQVSKDVLIKVVLAENIDTRTLQIGDLIELKTAENVFVDGNLVFAKGLTGKGKVEKVRKAKGLTGRNGKIEIDFFTLNCIDGNSIDIYVGEEAKNEMKAQGMIDGASLVGMNLNSGWNKFMVHGKNLEIYAGTELYVQTEKNINLYGLKSSNNSTFVANVIDDDKEDFDDMAE